MRQTETTDQERCRLRLPANGLCPICGEDVSLTGRVTTNGRLIATCGDAFTVKQWLRDRGPEELGEQW
ncbi:MAG TPA: hypothetical protein PLU30_25135 [Verrucomicrobiae bacterium]|nr:hypothetical protein [Verrucomicrobiae bacterium]